MEYLFCFGFPLILVLGVWLAKDTQDFIDFKNAEARLEKEREEI